MPKSRTIKTGWAIQGVSVLMLAVPMAVACGWITAQQAEAIGAFLVGVLGLLGGRSVRTMRESIGR